MLAKGLRLPLPRWRPRVGTLAWTVALLASLVAVAVLVAGITYALATGEAGQLLSHQALIPFITVGFAVLGALVAARRPRHVVGWLFLTTAVLMALTGAASVGELFSDPSSTLRRLASWLNIWLWVPANILPTVFVFIYYPDGQLPSPRWRILVLATALGLTMAVVGLALHPGPVALYDSAPNPYGWDAARPILDPLLRLSGPLLLGGVFASMVAVAVRFRRAKGLERQQIKWLLYAVAVLLGLAVIGGLLTWWWPDERLVTELNMALTGIGILGVALAAAVAILQYRLYDIDLIVNRTLVYGGLTALVVGFYVLSVGATGLAVRQGSQVAGLVLTAVVTAVLLRPMHELVQRGADRLVRADWGAAGGAVVGQRRGSWDAQASPDGKPRLSTVGQRKTKTTTDYSRWLMLARQGWYVAAVLALLVLILAIPGYLTRQPLGNMGSHLVYEPTPLLSLLNTLNMAGAFLAAALALGLAALLFWRRSNEGMALFLAYFLLVHGTVMNGSVEMLEPFWPEAVGINVFVLQPVLYAPLVAMLVGLFPDGRFVPRWIWLAIPTLLLVGPLAVNFGARTEVTTGGGLTSPAVLLGYSGYVVVGAALVWAQIYRYRRVSDREQRQQTKWVVGGLFATIFIIGLSSVPWAMALSLPDGTIMPWWVLVTETLWFLAGAILPITLFAAIMRYRLYDIDLIINRTLVYGSLTAAVVTLYVLVVGGLGAVLQAQDNLLIALLATGLVAALFQPLRARLQQGVNRLVYGERDEPVAVLTRLGGRLETTLAPELVLPTLTQTIAQALKLPYVAISLWSENGYQVAAEFGRPVSETVDWPLIYQSEKIGQLLVAPRSPNERFSSSERTLLQSIAHQAGPAVHAVQLTTALQRSRQRLVTAREEERRRLRRDLHDGLGSSLAALHLQAGAIRHLIHQDPGQAKALTGELRQDLRRAIDDIRQVVYALRPPALDQLGLAAAVRALAEQSVSELQVKVEAPERLPPLPAAVEVAAYRIIQEALANVIHHARARRCVIRLRLNGELHLAVVDDGQGLPTAGTTGMGLLSMRERAAELGGRCTVEAAPDGGTRVVARLPLPEVAP